MKLVKEWQTDARKRTLHTGIKNSERIFLKKNNAYERSIGMFDAQLQEMGLKKPELKRDVYMSLCGNK